MVLRSRSDGAVLLADGSRVMIRPVRASDEAAFVEAFGRLSAQTRWRRFCGVKPALSRAELRYLTAVDHVDHEALVAGDLSGRGLGVARYARDARDPARAEFAIVVCDGWQRRGLGTALSRRLVVRARAAGIRTLTADFLAENDVVVALLRKLGPARLGPVRSGMTTAEVDLVAPGDDRGPIAPPRRSRPVTGG